MGGDERAIPTASQVACSGEVWSRKLFILRELDHAPQFHRFIVCVFPWNQCPEAIVIK
jgi:hypothetical protein